MFSFLFIINKYSLYIHARINILYFFEKTENQTENRKFSVL
jgi:hypothetical protein